MNNFKFYIAQDNLTWMKMILFSAFCTNHKENSGSGTSSLGCLAMISRPCINIRYWSVLISRASSCVRGHRKFPFSIRLYRRHYLRTRITAFIRIELLFEIISWKAQKLRLSKKSSRIMISY